MFKKRPARRKPRLWKSGDKWYCSGYRMSFGGLLMPRYTIPLVTFGDNTPQEAFVWYIALGGYPADN